MASEDLDDLAKQLDIVFQNTLDRLEVQTRDAIIIDRALRQLLDQNETDESIINWDPERAISPKLAFRALALRLIHEADKAVTREATINSLDYEDLLAWPDEPRRRVNSAADEFLIRIEHARTKSVAEFWHQFQARIAPDRDPIHAQISATSDLLSAFAVELPTEFIVPFVPIGEGIHILPFGLKRQKDDLEWVIHQDVMNNVFRTNHALATICLLHKETMLSTLILEMNTAFHSKMKTTFRQYTPNEQFLAGGVLSLRMQRDHIDFRLSRPLFDMVQQAMSPVRGLHFVNTPKFN